MAVDLSALSAANAHKLIFEAESSVCWMALRTEVGHKGAPEHVYIAAVGAGSPEQMTRHMPDDGASGESGVGRDGRR